jgi:DNA-binding transcriptional LysR family regulator
MVPAGTDLDLSRLRVFVSVVDCNGYSAAAAHLNVSQATVSFHIRELERLLATKLLIYEHHKLRLTTAGEEVYRAAARMLHDADRLVQSVRDIGRGYSDRLSLGASIAFEQSYFFERVIRPFCRAHPATRLSLRFGHSVAEAEAVRTHELDLAYVLGWHRPSGVNYEPLHQATVTFLVSPEHRLAREEVVTVEDIAIAGIIVQYHQQAPRGAAQQAGWPQAWLTALEASSAAQEPFPCSAEAQSP